MLTKEADRTVQDASTKAKRSRPSRNPADDRRWASPYHDSKLPILNQVRVFRDRGVQQVQHFFSFHCKYEITRTWTGLSSSCAVPFVLLLC
ncbi:hypothetical protein GWI33_017790 [Rhynchophorus ferrugineus]|uniref:Uncharacterized protein n=1 Tax=Rhynchophorus ferrugineus TaxID=354439 RepID=A0A834HXH8_RHYFE|nr:hypothetical protein GWI33_017790 [Rhynchophorus ferrugineus]